MYPKLQSQGLAGGPNTGSCAAYAFYLEHENRWKKENGKPNDVIPFYDSEGNPVSVGTVIDTIDANKKGLHVEDAKFFSLVINPSEKEAEKLGKTHEEKIRSIQKMVNKMMDRYAAGFGKEGVKDHKDLLYYYTIHEFREDESAELKPGIHVHVIVSRKDLTGTYKLSPMTNHRGGTSGVIRSGFDRDSFYRDCENIFDKTFDYKRPILETYDYLNTIAHGSSQDKAVMIRAAVKEEKIFEGITAALARQAERLAKEAASAEAKKQREEELARLDADKKKRNEFWNTYHSYYRPLIDNLNGQCKVSYSIYKELKDQGYEVSKEIDAQYHQLALINKSIAQKRKEMYDADTFADLVKAFAFIVVEANPLAALTIALLLLIVLDTKKFDNKLDMQDLRRQADEIRMNIEDLKVNQGKLRYAQKDSLRQYIQVKDERAELTRKLQELRKELEPKKATIDLDDLTKELSLRNSATEQLSPSLAFNAFGIYGPFMSAETKLDLDLELMTSNTVIDPVFHTNGGVADFNIISNGEKSLASTSYPEHRLIAMLEKWSELTGQTPAYKLGQKPDTKVIKTNKTHQEPQKQTNKSYIPKH